MARISLGFSEMGTSFRGRLARLFWRGGEEEIESDTDSVSEVSGLATSDEDPSETFARSW